LDIYEVELMSVISTEIMLLVSVLEVNFDLII